MSQHRHHVIENATTGKYESVTTDAKLASIDTRLDESIGHINNMTDLGSGSNQHKACAIGVMPSGNGRILSCSADGHLNVDLQAGAGTLNVDNSHYAKITTIDTKLDSYAGGGNNNIGEGSTKLQIFNYGRDVSAGNYKPMVVNSSAEQIVALSATDNAVLDSIKTAQSDGNQITQIFGRTDIADNTTETAVLVDATGKISTNNIPNLWGNVVRNTIVAESGGAATAWVAGFNTTVIDTKYFSKLYLNYSGSQSSGHAFELHGSNDNATYYKVEAFTQADASGLLTHSSNTSGFRYFKIKNVGATIATTQGGVYNAFP